MSELGCGSHVDRLLIKLPPSYRHTFIEHCLHHGILQNGSEQTYTLQDFSAWLQTKAHTWRITSGANLQTVN